MKNRLHQAKKEVSGDLEGEFKIPFHAARVVLIMALMVAKVAGLIFQRLPYLLDKANQVFLLPFGVQAA